MTKDQLNELGTIESHNRNKNFQREQSSRSNNRLFPISTYPEVYSSDHNSTTPTLSRYYRTTIVLSLFKLKEADFIIFCDKFCI